MPVKIEFEADLTAVRAALDRLAADASSRPINLAGMNSTGSGGVTGGPPTVSGVFGGSQNAVGPVGVASVFPVGASPFARGTPTSAGVFGPPPGTIASTSALTANVVANAVGAGGNGGGGVAGTILAGGAAGPGVNVPVPGGGGGGSGGGGSNRFLGIRTNGLARYVGAGFLLNEAFRVGQQYDNYQSALTLAGNDQREALKAEQAWSRGLSDIPVVGRAASIVANAFGPSETGTAAILQSADAEEAQTANTKASARALARRSSERDVGATQGDFEREREQARAMFAERQRAVRDEYELKVKLDADVVKKQEIDLKTKRDENAPSALEGGTGRREAWLEQQEINDNASIASTRQQQADARKAMYGEGGTGMTGKVGDVETDIYLNKITDINRRAALQLAQTRAERHVQEHLYEGDRFGAQLTTIDKEEAAAKFGKSPDEQKEIATEFAYRRAVANRDHDFQMAQDRRESSVQSLLLGRDPHGAEIEAINRDEQAAEYGKVGDERRELRGQFKTRRDVSDQQFNDRRELRDQSLANRGRVLDAEYSGGLYARAVAASLEAKQDAFLKVQELEQSNGGGANNNAIRLTLLNAQKEEAQLSKEFINRFKPSEIDINRTDLSGGGGQVLDTLKVIADNTKSMDAKLDALGTAQ